MTIYLYVQDFPLHHAPVQNGVIKAVHGLAVGLAACGEPIVVISEGPQSAMVQTAWGYTHRCFAKSAGGLVIGLAPELRCWIQQQLTPQDLVILNGGFHPGVYACARSLVARGIPYVMAPHLSYDHSMFAKSPYRKHLYWYLCERYVLRSARAVQLLDPRQARWLTQRGVATPTIALPNGFLPDDLPPLNRLPGRQSAAPVQLLFFGRLCRHTKGLDLLLQAVAGLADRPGYPPPELTLQGPDRGDRAGLIELAQALGLGDRVHFRAADYVTPPTQIMAPADIVCLTSRSEGFGLAALEGMLAGRVLLVTETAGSAPYVQASGCGVVVKPDAPSIQAGLDALLACRAEWPAMGLRGRQQAIEQLPWQRIAQQARSHYQALMAPDANVTPLPLGDRALAKTVA
jgi:glycosyltransferase involved in cell wall biosynthesis